MFVSASFCMYVKYGIIEILNFCAEKHLHGRLESSGGTENHRGTTFLQQKDRF